MQAWRCARRLLVRAGRGRRQLTEGCLTRGGAHRGFLISSMKVMSRPQGWGRLTISRSSSTRVICSYKFARIKQDENENQIQECPVTLSDASS